MNAASSGANQANPPPPSSQPQVRARRLMALLIWAGVGGAGKGRIFFKEVLYPKGRIV
jgi:hypothetical protein